MCRIDLVGVQLCITFLLYSSLFAGGHRACAGLSDQNDPWIGVRASVVNLPRESDPESPSGGDYYEVYADALETMPVMVQINLFTKPDGTSVALRTRAKRWEDEIVYVLERNGSALDPHELRFMRRSEVAVTPDQGRHGNWWEARQAPDALNDGEALAAFLEIVRADGSPLQDGRYRLRVGFDDDAKEFFGMEAHPSGDVVFRVKERAGNDEGRYIEDLTERHYFWGCWLYKLDRLASKKEFEKAWELVWDYLRTGPGDEPDPWNITPRYQASSIAGRLDKEVDQIAYLSQLLSKDATEFANGRECKMRFYHFNQERGHIPKRVFDDLSRGLNDLYGRVYGKTMSGRELAPQPPLPKNFPDELDDSPRPAPSSGDNQSAWGRTVLQGDGRMLPRRRELLQRRMLCGSLLPRPIRRDLLRRGEVVLWKLLL